MQNKPCWNSKSMGMHLAHNIRISKIKSKKNFFLLILTNCQTYFSSHFCFSFSIGFGWPSYENVYLLFLKSCLSCGHWLKNSNPPKKPTIFRNLEKPFHKGLKSGSRFELSIWRKNYWQHLWTTLYIKNTWLQFNYSITWIRSWVGKTCKEYKA